MPNRAAIYCRISDDRAGAGLGVARQEADCRKLAEDRGLTVSEVYVDNDLSAYSGKPRPGYKALLGSARDRLVDVILAWHPDRLHRSPVELEEFISVCEKHDLQVLTVQSGEIDLSTPSGRMIARMLGSAARYESEHKAERHRRKALELARAGKLGGGGSRPFGFEADFKTLRPYEAMILRSLVARFLAGESIGSLVTWLDENHIETSTGARWTRTSLRRILRSGRISGQREHHDEILGPAEWEAIISPERTARIRAVLDDPQRRFERSPRRYLLSTLLRCHACDTPMVGRPREDHVRRYICPKIIGSYDGCGKTFILAEDTEDLIVRAILMRLDSAEIASVLAGQPITTDQMWQLETDAAQDELNELASLRGQRVISTAEWLAARAPIVARLDANRKHLSQSTNIGLIRDLTGQGKVLRREWASIPLTRQRAIVQTVMDHAVIGPGRRGFNRFDPNRVQPVWRI
jgi:site-specific DNA recombinase